MAYIKLFIVLSVAAVGCESVYGADVKIIANPSLSAATISAEELRGVFLATKTAINDGSRIEPVLEKRGAAHESFLKTYIGKTDVALETYYRSLVFSGKASMPKAVASDAEMVAYVAKTKGAIGYVSAGASTPGVKTLEVK